jgi:hypothetical protein
MVIYVKNRLLTRAAQKRGRAGQKRGLVFGGGGMRCLFVLTLALGMVPGFAATIQYEQGGWTDNAGPLEVTFSGQDGDGDGALVLSELTQFNAIWQTPDGTDVVWRLHDVEPNGFVFKNLGDYLLLTRAPDYSLVSSAFEGEVLASVFDGLLFPVASTVDPASAIPEPGSLCLVGIGTLLIARLRRRGRW